MSITTNGKISRLYKIKDFCIVGDGAHTSIKRQNSGIMYLTSKNFKPSGLELSTVDFISESDYTKYFGSSKKALITPLEGDVLFGIIGSLGVPCIVKKNDVFGISSSVAILRPQQGLISKYLYYFMTSSVFQGAIEAIKSGVAQSFLSLDMIRSLPLIVPSNLEQERISAILSAYDDLIENNDRRIALLEKMAEEIYREWFVRLRFPGFDRATFHKGIPEGWELKSIQDACYVGDGAHASVKRVDDGIPYLTTKNFKSDGLSLSTVDYISAQEYKRYFGGENKTVKTPRKGDILMGIIGSFGQPYLVDSDDEFGISSSVAILRPNLERISSSYLYTYTRSTSFLEVIHLTKSGSAQGFLSLKMIGTLPLLLPPIKLQKRFVDILQPILDSMKIMKNQRRILSQTRDRLLTRLISGKLSVEDLDIQFPPSMTTDS